MVNLNPIDERVQQRLIDKMRALGKETSYADSTSQNLSQKEMTTRTTFIKMVSGQTNAVVLHAGLSTEDNNIAGGYDDIYGSRTYKEGGRNKLQSDIFKASIDETSNINEVLENNEVKSGTAKTVNAKDRRPMPGIKSIDVSFKGGQRALREATVNWTCWSFEELNTLMPHFLAHGKTVLLQWGWVYNQKSLNEENIPSFIVKDTVGNVYIKADAYKDYSDKVKAAGGDFDMLVGIVKNFEFTTRDDGAFDCQTILSSVGVSIIDASTPNPELIDPGQSYNI